MNEEKDFILIEKYLDGVLEGKVLADFEQRLKVEPKLLAEVSLYKEMDEMMVANHEKQARKKEWTAIIHNKNPEFKMETPIPEPKKEPAKIRKLNHYFVRVAVIALLAIVAYFIWPKPLSNEQLATDYWTETVSFDYAAVDRSNDSEPEYLRQLKEAYEAYGAMDYQKVTTLSKAILPRSETVILLEGAADFQLGNYKNAIRNFNQILSKPKSVSKDEAMWYLALTYLKSGDRTKALTTLDAIIAQESWKYKEAQGLFDEIED